MRWLLFLSRVALICNVFFLLTLLLRYYNYVNDEAARSTIIIMGLVMATMIFNPLVNISYSVVLIRKKQLLFSFVPRWLVIANFIFLLIQLQYILF